jgi:hypothetical protein
LKAAAAEHWEQGRKGPFESRVRRQAANRPALGIGNAFAQPNKSDVCELAVAHPVQGTILGQVPEVCGPFHPDPFSCLSRHAMQEEWAKAALRVLQAGPKSSELS